MSRHASSEEFRGRIGRTVYESVASGASDASRPPVRLDVGNTLGDGTPAAMLERSYDSTTARLTQIRVTGRTDPPATPALDLGLVFDGPGRLQSQSDSFSASFEYDGLGRLREATGPWEQPQGNANDVTWTYSYDALGNLRAQTSDNPDTGTEYPRTWDYAHADKPRFLTEFTAAPGGSDQIVADSGGNPFTINLGSRDRDAFFFGGGVNVLIKNNVTAFLRVEVVVGDTSEAIGAAGGFSVGF